MTQKIAQAVGVDLVEALAEQLLHRGRLLRFVGVSDAIDTALAGHGPAVDPVRNIGVPIEAELHIGHQRLPHQSTGLLYQPKCRIGVLRIVCTRCAWLPLKSHMKNMLAY